MTNPSAHLSVRALTLQLTNWSIFGHFPIRSSGTSDYATRTQTADRKRRRQDQRRRCPPPFASSPGRKKDLSPGRKERPGRSTRDCYWAPGRWPAPTSAVLLLTDP